MFSHNALPPRRMILLAGLVAGTLATGLAPTGARAFQLVPISQDFEPNGRGANQTFQVENDRDEQVTVTIGMAVRKVDVNGKETMEETEDFTLFPTEVILEPKSTRLIRAKWVGEPQPKTELSYRIIAEETPLHARRDTPGASVFLTVRYVGSIYVVPKGARADVGVTSIQQITDAQGKQQLEVVVENRGTRHAILDTPTLNVTVAGVTREVDKAAVQTALNGENILAQSKRRVLLPVPQGLPAGAVAADLKYLVQ